MLRLNRRPRRAALCLFLALTLVAAACGGDDDDGGGDNADNGSATTQAGTSATVDPSKTYKDPRGGLYADFQSTFDRTTDPFSSTDKFCEKGSTPSETLKATDAASATSITVVHLRTKLEDLVTAGFAVPVGNTTDMFETFSRVINEQCGGINGRKIDLKLVEVPATSQNIDADRRAACITAT